VSLAGSRTLAFRLRRRRRPAKVHKLAGVSRASPGKPRQPVTVSTASWGKGAIILLPDNTAPSQSDKDLAAKGTLIVTPRSFAFSPEQGVIHGPLKEIAPHDAVHTAREETPLREQPGALYLTARGW
jgi:hypothetical protein